MELSLSGINDNSSSFSDEDVKEKYKTLKKQYDGMAKLYDNIQQELHDLKRSHNTAVELKDHLYSEIEALQNNEKVLKIEYNQKCKHLQEELDKAREEKWKESENLSSKIDALERKIATLTKENVVIDQGDKISTSLDSTKLLEDIRNYEEEITTLKESNVLLKTTLSEHMAASEVQKAEMESLKERIECLESNLKSKKEEMESMSEMLHGAQEELCNANMQLQQFKNSASSMAPKGNSLFAEVDDKRQEMLKTLSQMKEKVYQLNREVECKQAEIDALMCEKKTLWEDYSGQAKHHDGTLYRAYERRITDLEKQNKQLNRDIARWFEKHLDPQSSEAAQWVSGVLDHYRKENSRITAELTATSVNNLSAALELRELQRQIVTWRTKALEAKASVSELESRLLTMEKSVNVVNSTKLELSPQLPADGNTFSEAKIKEEKEPYSTPKEGFSQVDISAIKNLDESRHEKIKMKENQTPNIQGILATGEVRKVAKVTSFKHGV